MKCRYRIMAALLCVLAVLGAFGCSEPQYRVDYDGHRNAYSGAKDSYPAGETVTVYYDYRYIGSDTDESFYLDGERRRFSYEDGKGYRIQFVMPEHEVKLECRTENSMTALPVKPAVITDGFQMPGSETLRVSYEYAEIDEDGTLGYALRVYLYDEERDCLEFDMTGSIPAYYLVPKELLRECRAIAEENRMGEWKSLYEEAPRETGGGYTYRNFWCAGTDGDEIIRADTDRMPENGDRVFDQLQELLWTYATVAYAVQPPYWG